MKPNHYISSIPLRSIKTDLGIQQRANMLDSQTVCEYAEAIKSGAEFPAVVIFNDGTTNWLADGFHRVEAADEVGIEEIAADIRQGTKRDALLFAVGANRDHGLRRSRADIRRAIETLLGDAEWVQWSNRMIADTVRCSDKTVAVVRNEFDLNCGNSAVDSPPDPGPVIEKITEADLEGIKRIGRDGKARRAPQPKAKATPPPSAPQAPHPKPVAALKANKAVEAMQRAHHLAAALDRLNEVLGDLLPEDARTVASNLRRALTKLEERFGKEVTGDA